MKASRCYVVNITNLSVSAAITIAQIKAGALTPLEILRSQGGQDLGTTSFQQRIQFNRKSGAATVSAFTPIQLVPSDPAAAAAGGGSATGTNATVEGTDTDILWQQVFNHVGDGWLYLPAPDERIHVPPATFLGLKLATDPGTSVTFTGQILFRELN